MLATGNPDKARELCELLSDELDHAVAAWAITAGDAPVGFLVVERPDELASAVGALPQLATAPDVEETGTTLEENARIKARGIGDALGVLAVADDTGLEVDALGGAPGVYAARYAGEGATYADNVAKLLAALHAVPDAARSARFATVVVAYERGRDDVVVRGEVEGRIATEPRGRRGFGYDPVFMPREGDGRTFAEMTAGEKNAISHRGRALRALVSRFTRSVGER